MVKRYNVKAGLVFSISIALLATLLPKVIRMEVDQPRAVLNNIDGRFAKFKALKSSQKEKSKEMKAVLDKDQYKKYTAMMEEMKRKARERY